VSEAGTSLSLRPIGPALARLPDSRDGAAAALRRPLRVCFLIDRLSTAGTESQLLSLIRHLDRRRVSPFLCLLRGEDAESVALEPDSCPVFRLGVRSLHHPGTLIKALRFASFLRRQRVDVMQVYFPDSTNFGVTVARLAGVPQVVRTRFNLGYWMTSLDRWLGRFHSLLVDATVTNCDACRDAVIEDEWAKPESVSVVENGVELGPFLSVRSPSFAAGGARPRRVGMVANLRPVKDPQLFVEAARLLAARYPDLEFRVAGEGELRPRLKRLITEQRLQNRFQLLGRVSDIPAFLSDVDFAVLCSRSEGCSNALLEYMAAGRAIVATAVGGTLQLIEDGVHGLLVPPGDAEQLASALGRLLPDPALAADLAAAARMRVANRYDAGRRARRYEALYEELTQTAQIAVGEAP
jgi:glycosyltransferase involved in cell wall biosynthesis